MVSEYDQFELVRNYVQDGIAQGAVYFNTTLVLGATYADIVRVGTQAELLSDQEVVFNTVVDPSYPFLVQNWEIVNLIPQTDSTRVIKQMADGQVLMVRPEVTCAWFCGDRNNARFRAMFDGLELHP